MTIPTTAELFDFTGVRVLVTGASGGIGAAIARRFAGAGAHVALHAHSKLDVAAALADALRTADHKAVAVQADLVTVAGAERVVAQTVSALGGIDVLINNAGIYPMAELLTMTADEWDATLAANLRAVFLTTQAVARQMIAQSDGRHGGGAIVNIASIEGHRPAPAHAHYNAAKAGVSMHTKAAAAELGTHGIRVNAVSPGLIDRPGLEAAWPEGVDRYRARAPLGRLGTGDDVANACFFLASRAAAWITGADLIVDGGVLVAPAF